MIIFNLDKVGYASNSKSIDEHLKTIKIHDRSYKILKYDLYHQLTENCLNCVTQFAFMNLSVLFLSRVNLVYNKYLRNLITISNGNI